MVGKQGAGGLYVLDSLRDNCGNVVVYDCLHMGAAKLDNLPAYRGLRNPYNHGAIYRIGYIDAMYISNNPTYRFQFIGLDQSEFHHGNLVLGLEYKERVKGYIRQLDNVGTFTSQYSNDSEFGSFMLNIGLVVQLFRERLESAGINPYFINISDTYSSNQGFNVVALIGYGFTSKPIYSFESKFFALNFKHKHYYHMDVDTVALQLYHDGDGYLDLYGEVMLEPGSEELLSYLKTWVMALRKYCIGI